MEYRKRLKSDVWHFMLNCSQYPPAYEWSHNQMRKTKTQQAKPKTGEFCNQCLAKSRKK